MGIDVDTSATVKDAAQAPRAARRRTFQSATAIFNSNSSVVDCLIRNRSEGGFMIETPNSVSLPQRFDLHVAMDDAVFPVRIVWRTGKQVGLAVDPS